MLEKPFLYCHPCLITGYNEIFKEREQKVDFSPIKLLRAQGVGGQSLGGRGHVP